ncbi:hypothetical protein D0869_07112 [Hortaea werneckii]|uniref:Uncharacterized protein n=1 Tax=Hortaea werneckii TaxID=91943 RepID=A0A3M6YNH3_HORWE|nr:hypothetical protein KC316_g1019 [Hortaea werneckii]KAI7676547.1 hypothetical protein KC318_g186 [Hortaea werneckii]RMX81031.1 hypothetical protein D0869_07112 [Hortaea werneckii]RMY04437.1 hypothetical protein D0868_06945 [Hortaea werneckii]RMY11081.1 hypothetical protein D0867_08196 [Hortaea werneckii]
MGWFWDSKKPADDPYSKLDPALRDFLDKESPVKYEPSHSESRREPDTYRKQLGWTTEDPSQQLQQGNSANQQAPPVPPESLFQDGRYAHLWKNYRPQGEVDNAGKNEQDRLRDVIEAYNDRRAAIGRAAVENCVMEQMAERDCWENGTFQERMNMCRGSNREFMRCYTMQSRFLKALGYLSSVRSEQEEERIQMHADKLYHQMLDREAAAEKAREEGVEAPVEVPLIEERSTTQALGEDSAWAKARQRALQMSGKSGAADAQAGEFDLSMYSLERQKQIREQIKDLNPRERELELQLIAAETRSQIEYAQQIKAALDAERAGRLDRRERGKETVGDTIKRLWGWDNEK